MGKLMRKLILLFSLSLPFALLGQNQQIDSLLQVLHDVKDDTSKVNLLNLLSRRYSEALNFEEAKKTADEAMALARKKNFKKGITAAYINLGNNYIRQGNLYHNQENYPEALKYYLASLRIREESGDKMRMAMSYGNIGLIYLAQGNYAESLKNQFQSLKMFEELKDKNGVAVAASNVGLVYENQGDYQDAMKYYNYAIKMYEELGQKFALINRYFNIGFLYNDQGNFPEAIKYHSAALKLSEELGSKECVAASYCNLGEVYLKQAQTENRSLEKQQYLTKALDEQKAAEKIYKELESREDLSESYLSLGSILFEQKDYSQSKKYLTEALALSKEFEQLDNIKQSYFMLSAVDSAMGNWEQALVNHKSYVLFRDSIYGQDNAKKIMKAQMQYEFDKKEDSLKYKQALTNDRLREKTLLAQQQEQALLLKERELDLSNNEKEIQQLQIRNSQTEFAVQKSEAEKKQNQLAIINKEKDLQGLQLKKQRQVKNYLMGGLALLLVLSFFIYKSYRTRNQLRLQTLRNKIASDLHDDVGSTLSSISIFSQMAQQQSREVIPLLETIEESSRKMLDAMADIVWTINPENDQFEKIVLRMKSFAYELLGASNIDFEFEAGDEVSKFNVPMEVRKNLYLIFKEATNNMVKYAHASKAMFAIRGEKNTLTMMIHDDGKGFDLNKPTQGNGLKNMMRRASEIGAELLIETFPGNGTKIRLNVAV